MESPHSNDSTLALVLAWHAALNEGDADRVLALSDPEVEVAGPQGIGHGPDLLRGWIQRTGIELRPRRVFARDGRVVVEEDARWRKGEGAAATEPIRTACCFTIGDALITTIARHEDLAEALTAAGLNETDEHVINTRSSEATAEPA